jgi:hypothetical protein
MGFSGRARRGGRRRFQAAKHGAYIGARQGVGNGAQVFAAVGYGVGRRLRPRRSGGERESAESHHQRTAIPIELLASSPARRKHRVIIGRRFQVGGFRSRTKAYCHPTLDAGMQSRLQPEDAKRSSLRL